jgi:pyruvate formate lyase activating enzyme
MLDIADLVLFDIKHTDTTVHKALTGVDNDIILKNLGVAVQSGKELVMRFPMVPGLNDSEAQLAALAKRLLSCGIDSVQISAYHDYGAAKYRGLGLEPAGIQSAADSMVEEKRSVLARWGIRTMLI